MLKQHRIGKIAHSVFMVCILATAVVTVVVLNYEPSISPTSSVSSNKFSYVAEKDKTVFEQTQNRAGIEVKMTREDVLIQSINSVKSYGNKKWNLYVDGKLTFEDPFTYTTKGGESIEWRLE